MWFRIQYVPDRSPLSCLVGVDGIYWRVTDIGKFLKHPHPSSFAPHIQRRGKHVLPRGFMRPSSMAMQGRLATTQEFYSLIKDPELLWSMWSLQSFVENGSLIKSVPRRTAAMTPQNSPLLVPDPNGEPIDNWIVRYVRQVLENYKFKRPLVDDVAPPPPPLAAAAAAGGGIQNQPPSVVSSTTAATLAASSSASTAAATTDNDSDDDVLVIDESGGNNNNNNNDDDLQTILNDPNQSVIMIPFEEDRLPTLVVLNTPNGLYRYVPVP